MKLEYKYSFAINFTKIVAVPLIFGVNLQALTSQINKM